jgi:hypothetical protein
MCSLLADGTPFLIAKTRPDRNLLDRAPATDADLLRIERTDVDAGRFDARQGNGGGRHGDGTSVELWGSLAYSSNAIFPRRFKQFDRITKRLQTRRCGIRGHKNSGDEVP